ncbi:hypothetical protein [Imbroritus primus]|uniref:hypothetical protein n=1 Tax=Imbroritus primus TaxID=3058603 RepID=UPI003D16071B
MTHLSPLSRCTCRHKPQHPGRNIIAIRMEWQVQRLCGDDGCSANRKSVLSSNFQIESYSKSESLVSAFNSRKLIEYFDHARRSLINSAFVGIVHCGDGGRIG